jgi:hypothetical protein
MTEKLVSFLLLGILLALGWHLIYGRVFSAPAEAYWYVPQILVPALLLLALAWGLGFYRRAAMPELWVTLILLAIVGLTVPASYSCGLGCF